MALNNRDQHDLHPFKVLEEHLNLIKEFSKKFYDPEDDLHGLPHIARTLTHARKLWEKEGGNWALIEATIWLHDIGRQDELIKNQNHALLSEQLARPFLIENQFYPEQINNICKGIVAHSFSLNKPATTLEAKIVSDADKLDALGAIGIYRVCAYQAKHGHGIKEAIQHFYHKILWLKNRMHLKSSQHIAQARTARVFKFIEDISEELDQRVDFYKN